MADEPFTKPGLKIDRTRTPRPGEVLWFAEKEREGWTLVERGSDWRNV